MEQVHKDRCAKLIAFLKELPPEKFDMENYVTEAKNGCGTVCCAVGWMLAVFPEDFKWRKLPCGRGVYVECVDLDWFSSSVGALDFLGLPRDCTLFFDFHYTARPKLLPSHVADELYRTVESLQ